MKAIYSYLPLTHAGALLLGLLLGCAIFRLPQFACGPFRSDGFALYLAGIGSILAAVATVWAVRVAVRGGKNAIKTERQLRADEVANAASDRKRRAQTISIAFLSLMQSIATNVECWRLMADDGRFELDMLMESIEPSAMEPFEALVSKLDLFEESEARAVGRLYGKMADLVDQVKLNMRNLPVWNSAMKARQRSIFKRMIDNLRAPSIDAYRVLNKFSGENNPADPISDGQAWYRACLEEIESGNE
jgi:hypothetical protein